MGVHRWYRNQLGKDDEEMHGPRTAGTIQFRLGVKT